MAIRNPEDCLMVFQAWLAGRYDGYKPLAKRLGISAGAVKYRIGRARTLLMADPKYALHPAWRYRAKFPSEVV